jgi:hypothetical protein
LDWSGAERIGIEDSRVRGFEGAHTPPPKKCILLGEARNLYCAVYWFDRRDSPVAFAEFILSLRLELALNEMKGQAP